MLKVGEEEMLRNEVFSSKEEIIKQLSRAVPSLVNDGIVDIDKLRLLLDQDAEVSKETFGLSWIGKNEAIKSINKKSKGILRLDTNKSTSNNGKNLIIEGDNLEVLKLLQKSYHNKIKTIYIDPPYNTGNDFIYEDDFKEGLENYLKFTGQVDEEGNLLSSQVEKSGRKHSNWLNMMYPRLFLARNLLKENGIIFISIDENEQDKLKMLCDEIYGEENFLGKVPILTNPKGRSQDKYLATCHEYLFIYSKTLLNKGALSIKKTPEEIEKDYTQTDEKGKYRLIELRNTHREFGKFNRKNLYYPLYVNEQTGEVSKEIKSAYEPVYPIWDDGFEGCWTWGEEKAASQIDELFSKKVNGKNKIYRKSYANEETSKQLKSIWTDKEFHTEKGQATFNKLFDMKDKLFQSPKSVELIKQIINMSGASKDDIVLDFFAGSGTTAHAVMKLNKELDNGELRYILVQLPESIEHNEFNTIADVTRERVIRAATDLKSEADFKYYYLDTSNFHEWDDNIKTEQDITRQLELWKEPIKKDRKQEDILYEVLLKAGFTLTAKITKHQNSEGLFFEVEENNQHVFIVLEKEISNDFFKNVYDVAASVATQVCFLDESFETDDQKKNIQLQWEDRGITFRSI